MSFFLSGPPQYFFVGSPMKNPTLDRVPSREDAQLAGFSMVGVWGTGFPRKPRELDVVFLRVQSELEGSEYGNPKCGFLLVSL